MNVTTSKNLALLDRYPAEEMMPTEEWRDIPGYEGLYQVSDLGQVRSLYNHQGRSPYGTLKQLKTKNGYMRIDLVRNRKSKSFQVHRLVVLAFAGEPPSPQHEVNHKDGNRVNNCLCNLEYMTRHENMRHSYDELHRRVLCGTEVHTAKLTDEQVREIKRIYAEGKQSSIRLGKDFGVNSATILNIVNGNTWKHIR